MKAKKFLYLFIYLVVLGPSYGMWDLAPRLGIEPGPPILGARSPSHWTTRKVSKFLLLVKIITSHRLNYGRKNVRQQHVNLCTCKRYTSKCLRNKGQRADFNQMDSFGTLACKALAHFLY